MVPFKRNTEAVLKESHPNVKLQSLGKKVKLAWVYLVDVLLKTGKSHLPFKDVIGMGEELGFKKEEVVVC